jgi:predicted CXXCH cytochrome family protein
MKRFSSGRLALILGIPLLVVYCSFVVANLTGCKRTNAVPVAATAPLKSEACRACHEEQFAAWKTTDHALANRLPGPQELVALKTFPGGAPASPPDHPLMILGHLPIWQPLVPLAGGRWQAHEIAHDPKQGDWFNVFGTEERQPGEWGHWTGRGMNWNSMCAQCHMTGYKPNYDPATDAYHSSWIEQGIGCIQCHGEPPAGHGPKGGTAMDPFQGDRSRMMNTCAPCHARNEALTDTFKPGDNYNDHYRVVLPTEARTYYPDGQQRDEDFNWTSVLLSRMGHAGVTCLDCHDPHTSKTILPTANNALCMQCHAAPGRVMASGAKAVVIDPLAHSHHADGSAGNTCISCHMPTTPYMQRSPRHDHGWLKPDPLLTKELGIPNACSRCHEKEGIDWVITKADAWYGNKLDSHQRQRTRAVAAMQAGEPQAIAVLLKIFGKEDIPAWRATYLDLLTPVGAQPEINTVATASLHASDPVERAAAVRLLGRQPEQLAQLRPLLQDPVRLVRLDASLALTAELPADSASRRELDAYLNLTRDQPVGLTRIGLDWANRGNLAEADAQLTHASAWDSTSSALRDYLGQIKIARQLPAEAAAQFAEAARLAPSDGQAAYRTALAYAEAGATPEAERWLRQSVQRDPNLDRAWYNLGLLLAQKGDVPAALEAIAKAEKINPNTPDYPYAAATLHLRTGNREAVRAAAVRALSIDPNYEPALALIGARTLSVPAKKANP